MTSGARRVLHVQKVRGIAGSERHLLLLLGGLVERGWDVSMAVLEEPRRPVDDYIQALEQAGVRPHRFTLRADIDPLLLARLTRFVAGGRFDLVHTHLIHGDLYGTVAARFAGVASVVSSKHGYDNYANPSRLYRLVGRLGRWVDRVITISDALQPLVHDVEGVGRERMTTVYYGLPEKARRDRTRPSADGEFRIVTVGRLVPVKGVEHLLDAMALLSKSGSTARLLIVGDGPERPRLERHAAALQLGSRVEFVGWVTDVDRVLADADLFVSATLGEGFGLAILEAMIQQLPVVATRTVAIPEIVRHEETGLLVPPADAPALADAVRLLEQAPSLRQRLGRAGRERALMAFSIPEMLSRTEAIYRDVIERHAPRRSAP